MHSYTVCHVPPHPAFTDQMPLVIALVDLDEGVRMTTNIVNCPPHELRIGMKVEAVFDHITPEQSLVKFQPILAANASRKAPA